MGGRLRSFPRLAFKNRFPQMQSKFLHGTVILRHEMCVCVCVCVSRPRRERLEQRSLALRFRHRLRHSSVGKSTVLEARKIREFSATRRFAFERLAAIMEWWRIKGMKTTAVERMRKFQRFLVRENSPRSITLEMLIMHWSFVKGEGF